MLNVGPGEKTAAQTIHDMIYTDKSVDPAGVGQSGSAVLPAFFGGKCAMTVQGNYQAQGMIEQSPKGFNWAMFPPLKGTSQDQAANPQTLSISDAEPAQGRGDAVHRLRAEHAEHGEAGRRATGSSRSRRPPRASSSSRPSTTAAGATPSPPCRRSRRRTGSRSSVPALEGRGRDPGVPAYLSNQMSLRRPRQEADRRLEQHPRLAADEPRRPAGTAGRAPSPTRRGGALT